MSSGGELMGASPLGWRGVGRACRCDGVDVAGRGEASSRPPYGGLIITIPDSPCGMKSLKDFFSTEINFSSPAFFILMFAALTEPSEISAPQILISKLFLIPDFALARFPFQSSSSNFLL